MRLRTVFYVAPLVGAFVLSGPARAQDSAAISLPAQQLRPVEAGRWIRVDTHPESRGWARVAGKFLSADSASIYLDPAGPVSRLPVSRAVVRNLEMRTQRNGGAIGSRVGGLIGAATAIAIAVSYCSQEDCENEGLNTLIGATAFAAVGGALGWAVGFITQPHEVWAPAEIPSPSER